MGSRVSIVFFQPSSLFTLSTIFILLALSNRTYLPSDVRSAKELVVGDTGQVVTDVFVVVVVVLRSEFVDVSFRSVFFVMHPSSTSTPS